MGMVDIRRLVSRREFLGLGAAVVGAHFAAPTLGDLPRAEHLEHRVVRTGEATSLQERHRYPARIQFRDGRKEQTF